MRIAGILYKDQEAGLLTQQDDGSFTFRYYNAWMTDSSKPGISLSLPKSKQEYHSPSLFPFFFHRSENGVQTLQKALPAHTGGAATVTAPQ